MSAEVVLAKNLGFLCSLWATSVFWWFYWFGDRLDLLCMRLGYFFLGDFGLIFQDNRRLALSLKVHNTDPFLCFMLFLLWLGFEDWFFPAQSLDMVLRLIFIIIFLYLFNLLFLLFLLLLLFLCFVGFDRIRRNDGLTGLLIIFNCFDVFFLFVGWKTMIIVFFLVGRRSVGWLWESVHLTFHLIDLSLNF